jgi:CheY-like chemotaxis protein
MQMSSPCWLASDPCWFSTAEPPSVGGKGALAGDSAHPAGEERPRRVLVIEDDADLRHTILSMLGEEGFEAIGAEHGDAAFALLENGASPDVILLDLAMPVMDGWTFMSRLREMSRFQGVPVAVMSAGRNLVRAPVSTAYLEKPVRRDELVEVILRLKR